MRVPSRKRLGHCSGDRTSCTLSEVLASCRKTGRSHHIWVSSICFHFLAFLTEVIFEDSFRPQGCRSLHLSLRLSLQKTWEFGTVKSDVCRCALPWFWPQQWPKKRTFCSEVMNNSAKGRFCKQRPQALRTRGWCYEAYDWQFVGLILMLQSWASLRLRTQIYCPKDRATKPELLDYKEKYSFYFEEVHLVVMVSWGVVIPEGLITRKLGYAGIIYSILHPPLCIQRIVIFLFFKKCVSGWGTYSCECRCPLSPEMGVRSSGTRIAGRYEPSGMSARKLTWGSSARTTLQFLCSCFLRPHFGSIVKFCCRKKKYLVDLFVWF